jgi:ketosteroid isomerase-like protein
MSTSRRTLLAAAGASIAAADLGAAKPDAAAPPTDGAIVDAVAALVRRSADHNAALMRGDIDRYRALITLSDDFTLMSPFGGKPTHGRDMTPERMQAMGRFFRNGNLDQEVIATYGSADMVVLAIIERSHVEVGGLPAQDWALRVTLVYRRDGADWRLVHRHADPLVAGVSLDEAAALARGGSVAAAAPAAPSAQRKS